MRHHATPAQVRTPVREDHLVPSASERSVPVLLLLVLGSLAAVSCGDEARPPGLPVHALDAQSARRTGISEPLLGPEDSWLGGVTAAGDTVVLMVARDAEVYTPAAPLFPLILELRSETMVWPERYRDVELTLNGVDLEALEIPKGGRTHQIVVPRNLLGEQQATLRLRATAEKPGRKHSTFGYLLLSRVTSFWGPFWGREGCPDTLAADDGEDITVFLPSARRQWLDFEAWGRGSKGRVRVDVLSDTGDRRSLGTVKLRGSSTGHRRAWEWSHTKSERQRVTFTPLRGGSTIDLREVVFDPPAQKVVWSARRLRRADSQHPPIVVILLDALRSDRWGARREGRSLTPHLEKLGERGVLFRNARCHVPYTRGSMPTILTGCYAAEETGVRRDLGQATLASELREAGYATVAVSSNPFLRPGTELDSGFDLVVDVRAWVRDRAAEGRAYWAEQALDPLIEMLFTLGNQPFLLFVHLMQPHGPYCPPPPYDTLYVSSEPERLRGLEPFGPPKLRGLRWDVTDQETSYLRERYDGNVAYADHVVGRIVEILDEFGPDQDPVIVVLSDHGEALMEHGIAGHEDGELYEECVVVPLLLCGPGIPCGRELDSAVRLLDVTPTLIELAGCPPLDGIDGNSLVGLLQGGSPPSASEPVFTMSRPHRSYPLRVAVYRWPWKYILTEQLARGCVSEQEIFDLSRDPGETVNLVSYEGDLCAEFRALCATWLGRDLPEVAPSADGLSDDDRERLEALGYVTP